MSRLSMLEKFNIPNLPNEPNDEELIDEYDATGNYRAFGITRRINGSELMLNVVLKDGNHHTFSFSHLYRFIYNPSEGIQLLFTDHTVHIKGERLGDLHRYLRTQRVTFVTEADQPTCQSIKDPEPLIRSIVVERRQES